VDKQLTREKQETLAAAIESGREIGLDWALVESGRGKGEIRADARIRLRLGGKVTVYDAEVKRSLRPETLGVLLQRLAAREGKSLLVADHVTPPLAETLKERGVEFIDAAGNAYINSPPRYVWVVGRRPRMSAYTRVAAGRAFQPSGLKVLFALLCRPNLAARPYREIAPLAGVAHGTVGWVMPDLEEQGFLAEVKGVRRLMNEESLTDRWVEAYAQTLRPRLLLDRFRSKSLNWATDRDAQEFDMLLGGEPAAQLLTGHLQPETATLYADRLDSRFIFNHRLERDPRGGVEILRRFWKFEGERSGMTPTLLIYADLLAIGDARCLETAELIREKFLARS
jgi:hypothetical protein